MSRFTLYLLALTALASCATQTTAPDAQKDSCRANADGTVVRVVTDVLTAGVAELAWEERAEEQQAACEENLQAIHRAGDVCGGALKNLIDTCQQTCQLDEKCVKSTPPCLALKPRLWMSTNKSASEYEMEACVLSIAKADPVCEAALSDQSKIEERTHADLQATRRQTMEALAMILATRRANR